MQITFVGDPRGRNPQFMARHRAFKADDPAFIELYGIRFPLNQSVSVPDDSQWAKDHLAKIRANSHFEVEESEHTAQAVSLTGQIDVADVVPPPPAAEGLGNPLDHDGDGEPGGSLPAEDRGVDIEKLRADLKSLGGTPDMRWGAKRLTAEIDKALNG